ncbi:hypothetical protein FS749_015254, partial [Ceratobasidium sp. UAMH 11750]
NLYKTGFDITEFEDMKRVYPRWTGRRDKRGLPLYVYQLSALTPEVMKQLGATPPERRYQRIIALYEYMLNFAFSTCTALPPPESDSETAVPSHIAQATTIIDMNDTTLRQLIKFRSHLQEASTLATANYPETLGMIFVVGAPGWWSTVWGWVKVRTITFTSCHWLKLALRDGSTNKPVPKCTFFQIHSQRAMFFSRMFHFLRFPNSTAANSRGNMPMIRCWTSPRSSC